MAKTNKKIQLRFASSNSLASRLIRFFSHGEWSHVDVLIMGPLGFERYVSARIDGVSSRPLNYGKFTKTKTITIPVSNEGHERAMNFLKKQYGKPYDWTAILAFALDRDWKDDNSWFCSELAAAVLQEAGVFPDKLANGANKITPSDLILLLSAMNYN